MKKFATAAAAAVLVAATVTACGGGEQPQNVLFFLGDGMGIATMTAARIYKVGEQGELTMDTLPETAFIKTYSNNAQVTDSAPSMAAYMTGVKMNNEVISMTPDTMAFNPTTGQDYLNGADTACPSSGNGRPVKTLLELAKAAGMATGVVTTTRVTHATPAATYAHVCHRDAENTIAAQIVPGGAGYNPALLDGVDVLLGGGRKFFQPAAAGGARTDGRDLTAELSGKGYAYVTNKTAFDAVPVTERTRLVGLFTSSHMSYDIDRDANVEPSLAQMTSKAIDILVTRAQEGRQAKHDEREREEHARKGKGLFLMVEGGRIDHALHETTAQKALQDTVAFDEAIKAAIAKMNVIDPGLKNTLIVVTADHDHTLVLNGYAARTGPTTASNPGVLGLLKSFVTGAYSTDTGGNPYTIIGFGNGENRPATRSALTDAQVAVKSYHQEAVIPMTAGNETHGGTDVFLGAVGHGAEHFSGILTNTDVFGLIRKSAGL